MHKPPIPFFEPFYAEMISIYHDRLGTNILGKGDGQHRLFCFQYAGGVQSASQEACCALCKAHHNCGAGVWLVNGKVTQCYLKSGATQPYTRAGRYACVPKKNETVWLRADEVDLQQQQQQQQPRRVFARNLLPLVAPGQFELPTATVTATVNDDGGSITLQASVRKPLPLSHRILK
jgi:hypothetical protein